MVTLENMSNKILKWYDYNRNNTNVEKNQAISPRKERFALSIKHKKLTEKNKYVKLIEIDDELK